MNTARSEMTTTEIATPTLAARWETLRSSTKHLRTRDAASQLGVSEAELVASLVGAPATSTMGVATRLDTDTSSLLHALPSVGRCMALTRNESAVSEVRGTYGGIELGSHAGQVVGEGIDLRVFPTQWINAFAIDEPHPQKPGARRRSIHVFDRSGTAVHKIYLEPEGDVHAWDAIVKSRAADLPLVVEAGAALAPTRADSDIDVPTLVADWDAMTDTHEFFHVLRKHQVTRTQALRLAGRDRARRVRTDSLGELLVASARDAERIMIFVGNRGCLQIFSGTVERIVRQGPWLNVLDPDFNLHLREDHIRESWVVRKPTRAGIVSSLELYDANGDTIAMVFRKRDDREHAEDARWTALLEALVEDVA